MNLASVWKLPVIFVCENNLYQVFTSSEESCSVERIADRAVGYGMPGTTVDGNDVFDLEKAYIPAIERARAGDGPSLIECLTYRWEGHWPGDAYAYGGYRETGEVDDWKDKCPIVLLGKNLEKDNVISDDDIRDIHLKVEDEVEKSIEFAKESPDPDESELLKGVFI